MAPISPFKSVDLVLLEVDIGDLIEFRRSLGTYTHWAVYVGDGYAVHTDLPAYYGHTHATVRKELVTKIAGSDKCRVNNSEGRACRKGLKVRSPEEIVAAAESQIGNLIEYRLLSENCEYFATSCRYGTAFCNQVETTSETLITYGSTIAFIGAAAVAIGAFIRGSANSQRATKQKNSDNAEYN